MKKQQVIYHKYHNSITNSEQFVYSKSKINGSKFLTRADNVDYIKTLPRGIGDVTYQPLNEIKGSKEQSETTSKSSK